MANAQLTLEKLSPSQIMDIEKRTKQGGFSNRLEVMTAEELELYKGNCNEYIATAQEVIAKSSNAQVNKGQESLIKKYQGELELIQVRLDKIEKELNRDKIVKSSLEVELIDNQMIFLGVQELADFLGWDKRKVSVYRQRGKIERPCAMVGRRPLWSPKQAEAIKLDLGL
jgi:hypothetical protein